MKVNLNHLSGLKDIMLRFSDYLTYCAPITLTVIGRVEINSAHTHGRGKLLLFFYYRRRYLDSRSSCMCVMFLRFF